MEIRYEALATQAQDLVKAVTTRFHQETNDIAKELSRTMLAAIRETRASLERLEPKVAAWGQQEAPEAASGDPASSPEAAPIAPSSEAGNGAPVSRAS